MLENVLFTLVAAIIGTVIGSIGTWRVSRRLAFLERCHNQIEAACAELQQYRVAYAQLFVEYMSPDAEAAGRHWAKPVEGQLDMDYLELQRRVDAGRGRLRVHREILKRILPEGIGAKTGTAIERVLQESSHVQRVDCRVVDEHCDSAMEVLLTALPRK